jgi:IclR family transcriptional regulator, acetate operon repressor
MQNNGRPEPTYPISSVDNALRLLSLIGERGHVRVSEAAARLGTARSTAHRLLAMLEYHDFARHDPTTKSYVVGPALTRAGLAALEGLDLRDVARPVLERICEEVGETVHLVTLQGATVAFLDSVETSRALRVGSRVGWVMPAHCTAGGKAMLAQLSADQLRGLYPNERLDRMTPRSLSTRQELEDELTRVRKRRYATNDGESEDDVVAVAVSVPGPKGMRRAAITVSAPVTRLDEQRARRIAEVATSAAAGLRWPVDV